jgi:ubiquinone/menaquinone biosynthesis C-methylase UbiE
MYFKKINSNMFKVGTTNESNRVAWIEATLKKIPNGLTILDAGAGESQFKKYCSHLKYISQDFAQYNGDGNIGLQTGTWDNSQLDIVSDITSIPLEDNSVDAIMCTEVFEHIPNPIGAIKEFSRLLKPGGFLLTTAPFASLTHFAPYHFASGLSRFFYEKYLVENNFIIEDLQLNGNYFEYLAQENRRIKTIALKYSNKKIGLLFKIVNHLQLYFLEKLSKKDNGSSELLCYGIHTFSRKK